MSMLLLERNLHNTAFHCRDACTSEMLIIRSSSSISFENLIAITHWWISWLLGDCKEAYKKGDQVAQKRGRVKVQDEGKFVKVYLFVCTYLGATYQQWRWAAVPSELKLLHCAAATTTAHTPTLLVICSHKDQAIQFLAFEVSPIDISHSLSRSLDFSLSPLSREWRRWGRYLKKTEAGRLVSKRDLKEREGDETEDVRREELLATTARCAAVVAAVSGTPLFLQILNTCLVVEDQDFAILAAMTTAFSPSHAPLKNPFLRQKCIANLSSCCFSSLSQTFGTASYFRVRA